MATLHVVAEPVSGLRKLIGTLTHSGLSHASQEARVTPGRDSQVPTASFVDIRYLGSVRHTTGERALHWEKPEATLHELLRDLAIHYGPRFRYWVLDRGNRLGEHIIVRINGRDARYLDDVDTILHTGDTLTMASTKRFRPRI
jgi:molybdopterin converting factor small subunit